MERNVSQLPVRFAEILTLYTAKKSKPVLINA